VKIAIFIRVTRLEAHTAALEEGDGAGGGNFLFLQFENINPLCTKGFIMFSEKVFESP
jgi:hypothetical protein